MNTEILVDYSLLDSSIKDGVKDFLLGNNESAIKNINLALEITSGNESYPGFDKIIGGINIAKDAIGKNDKGMFAESAKLISEGIAIRNKSQEQKTITNKTEKDVATKTVFVQQPPPSAFAMIFTLVVFLFLSYIFWKYFSRFLSFIRRRLDKKFSKTEEILSEKTEADKIREEVDPNLLKDFLDIYHKKTCDVSEKSESLGTICTTINGETVRSKGERFIANYFFQKNIKYEYEKPLEIPGFIKEWVPDFYLPDYDVYVEFWGGYNSIKGYGNIRKKKMFHYSNNNIPVVSLFPDNVYVNGFESILRLDNIFSKRLNELRPGSIDIVDFEKEFA